MSLESIQIPHFPSSLPIYAALYRDVQNAPYLRQQLVSANSDFEYAFIDASMIYSRAHALAAVFRGVNDYLNNRLRTHNVHAEIVVSLSPTNNIADSYRKFGITDSTTDLLVFKVPVTPSISYESVSAHLGESVEGSLVAFNDDTLSAIADVAKIKKAYKLGSLPSQPAKADQVNGHDDGRRQLEICLLGAIALRGAT